MPREPAFRVLTAETVNKNVLQAQYAVRGAIPLRAEELREKLEAGESLPFKSVINCNIGNPQQLNQKPLTFLRQIAALTDYPELIDSPDAAKIFPSDALARAKSLVHDVQSTGAYSHSMGVPAIRKRVAKFIENRDGHPSDPNQIYLTGGASSGVSNILHILLSSSNDGILIPIPQYPLYTAAIALNGARAVPYYLDESHSWGLDVNDLESSIKKARSEGTNIKAMVVINPGNPTGNTLSRQNMEDIVKVCYNEGLILLADEVYQDNTYLQDRPFISFKKIVAESEPEIAKNLELVSCHSISKGQTGECGRRGGYFELVNFSQEAQEQFYKLASIQLCPPLSGQIGVDVLVDPPKKGDESYDLWTEERQAIAQEYKQRSEILVDTFNQLEGVTCNPAEGAMYLFPTLTIPPAAVEAAKKAKMTPDAFYCLKLLESTGICTVPGSGFGQKDGSWHLRTTFLPKEVKEFGDALTKFHEGFIKEYGTQSRL